MFLSISRRRLLQQKLKVCGLKFGWAAMMHCWPQLGLVVPAAFRRGNGCLIRTMRSCKLAEI